MKEFCDKYWIDSVSAGIQDALSDIPSLHLLPHDLKSAQFL